MTDWKEAEMISLEPLTWDRLDKLSERERNLQAIGDNIAYWLRYTIEIRDAEHMNTTPDAAIMLPGGNAPPVWPNVGQLKRWLLVLRGDLACDSGSGA